MSEQTDSRGMSASCSVPLLQCGTRRKIFILALFTFLIACSKEPEPWCCSITHLKEGKCLPGYERKEKFFREQDGSLQPGCVMHTDDPLHFSVDVLKSGESIELPFLFPLPEEEQKPTKKL